MKRREFLKLVGTVLVAPSIPTTKLEDCEFMYRGQKFNKDFLPRKQVIQIFMETKIRRKRYCRALYVEPETYEKCRDMYCDQLIVCMKRVIRKVA